jgi:transposase InsO family protein
MKMQRSMSREGHCRNYSPTERFFGSLQHEQPNYETFKTQAEKTEPDRLFGSL